MRLSRIPSFFQTTHGIKLPEARKFVNFGLRIQTKGNAMIRLTFLGTGTSQGIPMIGCNCEVCRSLDSHDKRLRSSVMIERFDERPDERPKDILPDKPGHALYTHPIGADARIVIDAGPDFRTQMLRENVKTLDAILLTHEHKDHMGGIDDVRSFNFFQGCAVPIYATERVGNAVKKDFDYAFSENRYPGVPEIDLRTIHPNTPFDVAGFHIIPITGRHYMLPVTGYRIGNLAYLTDFNHIEDSQLEKLKGLDTLVINALRYEPHLSHFTVDEAINISHILKPHRTYLTHLSHQIGLYAQKKDTLPQGIEFAYDGLKIDIE